MLLENLLKNMIQISKPNIDKKEIDSVLKVLNSGHLVQGAVVQNFEKTFSEECGVKFAIATNSGTSALHTALYAAGIKEGDEVITTPFTFVATANSILMLGARPIFADIDPGTFNIDPTKIIEKINKRTKAILVVNLFGLPANYKEIKKIANKYNLIIVEDAAQSVGASYFGKQSGNLADIACFSLYATKNIISGEGGMITTSNKLYFERSKRFRNHGQDEERRYIYHGLGYNYRMTDLSAAIGLEQIKKLKMFTKRRQEIAEKYNSEFKNIEGIIVPEAPKATSSVYHQYTLRVTKKFKLTRDELKEYLLQKGIGSNVYYPVPLYRFKHLKFNSKISEFPVAEQMSKEVISIPVHPLLSDVEVKYIIRTIKSI